MALKPQLIGELVEEAGKIGKQVVDKIGPAVKKLSHTGPVGVHGAAIAAAGLGLAAGVAGGAKQTVKDWAQDTGFDADQMNDYAVRSTFSGSKGRSTLAASTDGLTLSLSGKSTTLKSINTRY